MIPVLLILAPLAARAAVPPAVVAGPWATLTVTGEGLNPTQEIWQFGLSGGGTLYVTRTGGSRSNPTIYTSLTSSPTCPALLQSIRSIASLARAPNSAARGPLNGLAYRLDVISPRIFAGVRGPLHLTGGDLSPLGAWTRELAQTIDRCSSRHRRAAFKDRR